LHLHVAGWRHIASSYGVVNQWQLLALLKRGDVRLSAADLPLYSDHWKPSADAFSPAQVAAISAIPTLTPPANGPDAEYRISYPFDFSIPQYRSTRHLLVFGTSEFGTVRNAAFGGASSLTELNQRDDLTIVTPSRWSKAGFVVSGVDERKVALVPHGVDTSIFRADAELRQVTRANMKLEGFVFLTVGAMSGNKGMELLLSAFASVLESGGRAKLLLKGLDGYYASQRHLNDIVMAMKPHQRALVLKNSIYLGQTISMANMAALFNAADAYVSPYRAEGFNMPVLEAAACGLPIICTGGGPTDDFTDDRFRKNIDSQEVHDPDGNKSLRPDLSHLTDLMRLMEADETFRRAAQISGPEHVRRSFQWDAIAERLVTLARG
jgi:glycosyltransferase involved in cell wall biosynthesis